MTNIKIDYIRMTKPLVRNIDWYDLYGSLRDHGQRYPLLVKRLKDDYFEVIDGNKRLGAAFALGWTTIKCEIVQ